MSLCTVCKKNKANANKKWCEPCYIKSKSTPQLHCTKCKTNTANFGFSLCQPCFLAERGEPSPPNPIPTPLVDSVLVDPSLPNPIPTLCSKCDQNPPNPGYTLCQSCYDNSNGQTLYIVVIPTNNVPLDSTPTNTGNTVPSVTTTPTNNTPGSPTPKLCSNCKSNDANSGYPLCQECYNTTKSVCTKCFINTPNPGKSWCSVCWEASKMCAKCKKKAPNTGKKWCQTCFNSKNTKLCKKCMKNPHNNGFALCQSCWGHENELKLISTKTFKSNKYSTIEKQFEDGMAKKKYKGTIIEILSVYDKKRNTRYEAYKQNVAAKNKGQPNEKRWWHGSNLGCDLWNTKQTCSGAQCHICNILKSGFLMRYANTTNSWGRFGAGLYFAPDAAKSNDYAKAFNNVKCLILCKVVVGNARVFIEDQPKLTAPPQGYDSVLGKPGTGGALNFPELVLYTEEAMLPAYVVFYK